jgi:hypothetical protein
LLEKVSSSWISLDWLLEMKEAGGVAVVQQQEGIAELWIIVGTWAFVLIPRLSYYPFHSRRLRTLIPITFFSSDCQARPILHGDGTTHALLFPTMIKRVLQEYHVLHLLTTNETIKKNRQISSNKNSVIIIHQ